MLDDLTAKEIVALVQLIKTADERALVLNDDGEMTFLINLPQCISLMEKINKSGEREDVKKLIEKIRGDEQ